VRLPVFDLYLPRDSPCPPQTQGKPSDGKLAQWSPREQYLPHFSHQSFNIITCWVYNTIVCLFVSSKGCFQMSTYPAWQVVEHWWPAPSMAAPPGIFVQNTSYCVDMLSYYRPRPMEPSVGALVGVLCAGSIFFILGASRGVVVYVLKLYRW
jgi:hypothetical protein